MVSGSGLGEPGSLPEYCPCPGGTETGDMTCGWSSHLMRQGMDSVESIVAERKSKNNPTPAPTPPTDLSMRISRPANVEKNPCAIVEERQPCAPLFAEIS